MNCRHILFFVVFMCEREHGSLNLQHPNRRYNTVLSRAWGELAPATFATFTSTATSYTWWMESSAAGVHPLNSTIKCRQLTQRPSYLIKPWFRAPVMAEGLVVIKDYNLTHFKSIVTLGPTLLVGLQGPCQQEARWVKMEEVLVPWIEVKLPVEESHERLRQVKPACSVQGLGWHKNEWSKINGEPLQHYGYRFILIKRKKKTKKLVFFGGTKQPHCNITKKQWELLKGRSGFWFFCSRLISVTSFL